MLFRTYFPLSRRFSAEEELEPIQFERARAQVQHRRRSVLSHMHPAFISKILQEEESRALLFRETWAINFSAPSAGGAGHLEMNSSEGEQEEVGPYSESGSCRSVGVAVVVVIKRVPFL